MEKELSEKNEVIEENKEADKQCVTDLTDLRSALFVKICKFSKLFIMKGIHGKAAQEGR